MRDRQEDVIFAQTLKECLKEFCSQESCDPLEEPWGGYFAKSPKILAVNVMGEA